MAKDALGISEIQRAKETISRPIAKLASTARIDPPHDFISEPPLDDADGQTPAIEPPANEPESEQFRLQAEQLTAHLSSRQKELDHREAELNSRTARLESEVRTAKLWIDEHENDLNFRSQAMARREEELAARAEAVAKGERNLLNRRQELDRREQELLDRRRELSEQERKIKQCLARVVAVEAARQQRDSTSVRAQAEELQRAAEQYKTRKRQIERMAAGLAQEREAVQRQADHADRCRASLEQLRGDLERIHRETLEIRLATEELWVELAGAAPPAALVQSLGRIRAKLADQYRQAGIELAEQQKELETIRGQLGEQHEKLVEHKRQVEQWAADRREECDRQASRLVACEQELRREKAWLRKQWRQWQAEAPVISASCDGCEPRWFGARGRPFSDNHAADGLTCKIKKALQLQPRGLFEVRLSKVSQSTLLVLEERGEDEGAGC